MQWRWFIYLFIALFRVTCLSLGSFISNTINSMPCTIIIINGTTARLGPWTSLRVFVMVRYVRCEDISPTINLILVILIRPPETSVNKASRHLVAKQVKRGWESWPLNFAAEASIMLVGFFNMPWICDMGPTALLPLRRKACYGIYHP
jgi:hypothetical protein